MPSFAISKDNTPFLAFVTSMLVTEHLIQPLNLFTPESQDNGESPGTQQRLYHMQTTQDESRPLCTRCAKSGIKCEGYQDKQAFVWVDPKKPEPKQNTNNAESSSAAPALAAASSETLSVQPTSAAHQEAFFASIDPVVLQNFVHFNPAPKLGSPTFQESIYQTHLFQHLLGYTEMGKDSALSFPVMNATDLNRDSVNALSTTFFGRMHHLTDTSHQGDLLYSKAILLLAGELHAGNEALSTPVLRAILSLAIHEIVNCSAYNGWVQHVGGIGHLIETRGPWRHQTPDERVLFESCRPLIIAKALSDQKRTFLEKSNWQEIPWALNPGAKAHQSRLFDVLSFVPGLLEDLNSFRIVTNTTELSGLPSASDTTLRINEQKRSAQITINAHLSFLDQWYQAWSTTFQDAVHTITSPSQFTSLNTPYPLHIFGKPLLFPSLLRASEYTLYNLAIFLLLTVASQISSPLSSPRAHGTQHANTNPSSTSATLINTAENLVQRRRHAATEICKAIPYHLQFDLHAYSGAYLLCFPLNILMAVKGTRSEEGKWIALVLADIESSWGIMAGNAWQSRPGGTAGKDKGSGSRDGSEDW